MLLVDPAARRRASRSICRSTDGERRCGARRHPSAPAIGTLARGASIPDRNAELAAALARDPRPVYEVAGAAHVNPSSLSGYVTGRLVPPPDVRTRIARALGCSEEELFPTVAA